MFLTQDGPLLWTEPQQGLVLGSYFWGYFLTQLPGGRLAETFGGNLMFLIAGTVKGCSFLKISLKTDLANF